MADTGAETMTGGRVRRVRDYLEPDEPFCMTYGDGLSDVDISAVVEFHRSHDQLVTLTAGARDPASASSISTAIASPRCTRSVLGRSG